MSDAARCDLLVKGGTVYDGDGGPGIAADVAITGERVVAVGALSDWRAEHTLDAAGKAVAPGFIDTHTHDDMALLRPNGIPEKTAQGVTTVVVGNCGVSAAPFGPRDELKEPPFIFLGVGSGHRFERFADYMAALAEAKPDVHVVPLVGHSNLRAAAMDDIHRPATESEIARMRAHLDEAMNAGAAGFSTGLAYPSGAAAPTDEIVELAKVAGAQGGLYATHMRNESDAVVQSVEEAIHIGRRGGLPVVISHHKCGGTANWGKSVETLARIDAASASGQSVNLDAYPYTASSTGLMAKFARVAERVLVTESDTHPEQAGRELAAIMADWGCDFETAVERLLPAKAVYFQMSEDDLERILSHPNCMVGSDGMPSDKHPHPRLYGTFPRVLGHYARERGLFDLAAAVHKMTGLPARCFGLKDRGRIAPGMAADVVVFDAARIIDCGTYEAPVQAPDGIEAVIIAGRLRSGG
ncbi:MAG: D-aminoacylase [Rhodospirillaceae bacterium]